MTRSTSIFWAAALCVTIGVAAVLALLSSWNLEPDHPVSHVAAKLDGDVYEAPTSATSEVDSEPVAAEPWTNPLIGQWRIDSVLTGSPDHPRLPVPSAQGVTTFEFTESTVTLLQTQGDRPVAKMARPYSYKRGQDNEVIIRMTDTEDRPVGDETTLRLVGDELIWLGKPPFALVFHRKTSSGVSG